MPIGCGGDGDGDAGGVGLVVMRGLMVGSVVESVKVGFLED